MIIFHLGNKGIKSILSHTFPLSFIYVLSPFSTWYLIDTILFHWRFWHFILCSVCLFLISFVAWLLYYKRKIFKYNNYLDAMWTFRNLFTLKKNYEKIITWNQTLFRGSWFVDFELVSWINGIFHFVKTLASQPPDLCSCGKMAGNVI